MKLNAQRILGKLVRAARQPRASLRRFAELQAQRFPLIAKPLLKVALSLESRSVEKILIRGEIALIDRDLLSAAKCLRDVIAIQPTVSTMYRLGVMMAKSNFADEEYEKVIKATVVDETLKKMMVSLLRSPKAYHPSQFWLYFMLYNAFQVDAYGVENFKRTANNNYFTWTGDVHVNEQTDALERLLESSENLKIEGNRPEEFSAEKWEKYKRFLVAIYRYARAHDALGILDKLEEPLLGNPIFISINGRRISQDLCHTVIELNSILPALGKSFNDRFTVYELGAGHGRIGRALLSLYPNMRYVVIDILPALHLSQWYLSRLYQSDSIFRFRDFDEYKEVAAEFESSRLAFLLPHQAAKLPAKSADLFINICSIQEMTRSHVDLWFAEIDRLCRGQFYTKQYFEHTNDVDGFSLTKSDYPVKRNWGVKFDRQCEAFPSLFEAQYSVGYTSDEKGGAAAVS